MKIINEYYEKETKRRSDIYLHLPRLKEIGKECDSVIEFGTRHVVSAWALAKSRPKKLTCVDLQKSENIAILEKGCREAAIEFNFIQGDTLKIGIEETDMIFIDTKHTYEQLKKELQLHGNKAQKFLAFHDTETFGHVSENHDKTKGLLDAIYEFIELYPHWKIYEKYDDNNGLTILKRSHAH